MKTEQPNFTYQLLNQATSSQAIDCLCSVFSTHEPLGKALGIRADELRPFVTDLVHYAVENQLSWVAIHEASSRLAGVKIFTDFEHDFIPDDYNNEKLDTIFKFLHSIYDYKKNDEGLENNKLLHCWMTAVWPEFQRQGVLRKMYQMGASWAYKQGYRHCISEVTSQYNLAFLEKETEVTQLNTLHYAQYETQGTYPFLAAEDSKMCVLCRYLLKDTVAA
ncbi:GNAT family N-acetyltransferase [Serratia sp. NPDC078593]|uniref:GNAT family N-acetyltransferase n=1 Tax=unclassified Serratia (in: enterobacteria) TaxID=2647522 RepID=UPI0037D7DED7